MDLYPLGDRIIVRRKAAEESHGGSIIIPERHRQKPQEGVVLAVGSGRLTLMGEPVPPQCKVGDRVLFGKFTGIEVTILEETVLVLREDDILGILR